MSLYGTCFICNTLESDTAIFARLSAIFIEKSMYQREADLTFLRL